MSNSSLFIETFHTIFREAIEMCFKLSDMRENCFVKEIINIVHIKICFILTKDKETTRHSFSV